MFLNQNSAIINLTAECDTQPVCRAIETLRRDLGFVCCPSEEAGGEIRLLFTANLGPERYILREWGGALEILAGDMRGFIYGIYAVSRELLGVQDFWFWNDQRFEPRDRIDVPKAFRLESTPFAVRFRGWFINDEVLLHAWTVDRRAERPWEMAFEALLRCGGNMVIPGTGQNAKKFRALAAGMGLILTHHHAEPLGAEMFARAYPALNASYAEHPEKFHQLWERALKEQAHCEVVWNLGFRGQGDRPFWDDDPQYATPEARGELMGALIREQYELVQTRCPGAVCATICTARPWSCTGTDTSVCRRRSSRSGRTTASGPWCPGGRATTTPGSRPCPGPGIRAPTASTTTPPSTTSWRPTISLCCQTRRNL